MRMSKIELFFRSVLFWGRNGVFEFCDNWSSSATGQIWEKILPVRSATTKFPSGVLTMMK